MDLLLMGWGIGKAAFGASVYWKGISDQWADSADSLGFLSAICTSLRSSTGEKRPVLHVKHSRIISKRRARINSSCLSNSKKTKSQPSVSQR
jgi:hypothetical protein